MKSETEKAQPKPSPKQETSPITLIHKSSTKKLREPLRSPKKHPPRSKQKLSNSQINLSSYRKNTEQREKPFPKDKYLHPKEQKQELGYKKDKRSIEPTEKIVERINSNLQLLQLRIHQLFQQEIYEERQEEGQGKYPSGHGDGKGGTSLVFKKNGSTLSLTKNSSKKRLEGRLTHEGIRSDRKYKEMGKGSNVRVEAGWK